MVYTCPMHPEVRQNHPGNCPKCAMTLVPIERAHAMTAKDRGLGQITWKSYAPFGAIIFTILFIAVIVGGSIAYNFMTGFFLVFSVFKLIDLKGFAEGYSTYDLLAMRVKAYGYIYPFLELGFGLLMVLGVHYSGLFLVEFIIMAFSGIGVAIKIAAHEKFRCVCLGTFLKIPLTTVTLIEDFGMALLALFVLLY
jgi:hypothetical protein